MNLLRLIRERILLLIGDYVRQQTTSCNICGHTDTTLFITEAISVDDNGCMSNTCRRCNDCYYVEYVDYECSPETIESEGA